MERFDMVVIGAGPAGEKAATQAAYFGKRVAIVERRASPGGIAVSDAGIPTKTLRETALYLTGFRQRSIYGLSLALDAGLKLERLRSRIAEVVAMMTEKVRGNIARRLAEVFGAVGRGVVLGAAVPGSARRDGGLEVRLAGGGGGGGDGEMLRPEHVLFAGGRIGNTEGLGLAEAGVRVDARGRVV